MQFMFFISSWPGDIDGRCKELESDFFFKKNTFSKGILLLHLSFPWGTILGGDSQTSLKG